LNTAERIRQISTQYQDQAKKVVTEAYGGDAADVLSKPVTVSSRLTLDNVNSSLLKWTVRDESTKEQITLAVANQILQHDAIRFEYATKAENFRRLAKHHRDMNELMLQLLTEICADEEAMNALSPDKRERVKALAEDRLLEHINKQLLAGTAEEVDHSPFKLALDNDYICHIQERMTAALKTLAEQYDNVLLKLFITKSSPGVLSVTVRFRYNDRVHFDNVAVFNALQTVIPKGIRLELTYT
jgi:hypothetical protein